MGPKYMAAILPDSVRVIVRGWLSSNMVVLRAPGDNVLVDSGYCTRREETLELLASRFGLDREPLERLVNTHCHSDHMGGNAAVAHAYGCRVTIPEGEAKHVQPWTPQSVWMAQFDQRADPFNFDDTLAPGDSFAGGGFQWQVHAAPGHDMDALMFFEPSHRILISGDALWERGMGFVWPEGAFVDAAHATLTAIDGLDPAVVIPGHGEPFTDARGSIAHVRSRLDAFARDSEKGARHAAKVFFVFALLDRGSMPVAEVPGYVARVPCYRQLSERIGLDIAALANWLLADLARSGAIRVESGNAIPTMAA
jgi:glyoxylase-like metal-dependent hydrolase (beta-lactamase superfamily II)